MNKNEIFKKETKRCPVIEEMRRKAHQRMREELEDRLRINPEPTEQEVVMGAFREMLEPQVRQALDVMYNKGYQTDSSGFYWEKYQAIDGWFEIDEVIESEIKKLGGAIKRYQNGYTFIIYEIDSNETIESMTKKWDAIANVLPNQGRPARFSSSVASRDFRKKYSSPEVAEGILKKNQTKTIIENSN